MEDQVQKLPQKEKDKLANRVTAIGLLILSIGLISAVWYYVYQTKNSKNIITNYESQLKTEFQNKSLLTDSLISDQKTLAKYAVFAKILANKDSALKSLRYKVGDIVKLKPDSLKGVVQNIFSDNDYSNFYYSIIIKNNNEVTETLERKDALLY